MNLYVQDYSTYLPTYLPTYLQNINNTNLTIIWVPYIFIFSPSKPLFRIII